MLLAGGLLLLGVAVAGTRALGRWTFLPFAVGLLVATVYLLPPLVTSLGLAGTPLTLYWPLTALPGLGWVLLGGVMMSRAPRQSPGDERTAPAT